MRARDDLRDQLVKALGRASISLERMESRDGAIISYWRIIGRNVRGVPTLGIRANGRSLNVRAVTVDSIVDGRAHSRTLIDLSQVMAQIGDLGEERSTA